MTKTWSSIFFTTTIQYCFRGSRQYNKTRKISHTDRKNEAYRCFIHGWHAQPCIRSCHPYKDYLNEERNLARIQDTWILYKSHGYVYILITNNCKLKLTKNIIYNNITIYGIPQGKFGRKMCKANILKITKYCRKKFLKSK